jgi:hypothetical protein
MALRELGYLSQGTSRVFLEQFNPFLTQNHDNNGFVNPLTGLALSYCLFDTKILLGKYFLACKLWPDPSFFTIFLLLITQDSHIQIICTC